MVINLQSHRARRVAFLILLIAAGLTVLFGLRTYRSFQFLQSAYVVGAPKTSAIRGWMTLNYVAGVYRLPERSLAEALGLPLETNPDQSLKSVADALRVSPLQFVQRVQHAIAERAPRDADQRNAGSTWFGTIGDQVLTWLVVYGYSALGLTVFFGSIGLPLPDGLAMALAGSLAEQGRIGWAWAALVAVFASVLGDLVGYGIGRLLGQQFLEKRGRWIGYSPARRAHIDTLFARWGLLTVFITRTFVSYLSSVANIFAGVSRFEASKFLGTAICGRLIWAAAYMGLGYSVGADLEAAASFLANLSFLILSLVAVTGSSWTLFNRKPTFP